MWVRIPERPQYPDFSQKGQSMIAFCGLFLSITPIMGAGDVEDDGGMEGDGDRGAGEVPRGVVMGPLGRGDAYALPFDCVLLL